MAAAAAVRAAREESGVAVPPDVSLLPVMEPEFNLREIAKQMILLESHLAVPRQRCADCIRKHYATIEALAEEGSTLDAARGRYERLFHEIAEFARHWQARLYAEGVSGAARGEGVSGAAGSDAALRFPAAMRLAAAALRKARKPILKASGIAFFDGKRYALVHHLARAVTAAAASPSA